MLLKGSWSLLCVFVGASIHREVEGWGASIDVLYFARPVQSL
jgi:hypothetical protein